MKKNTVFYSLLVIIVAVLFGGCALITPPPWVNSETKIIKDSEGKITGSQYTRKVTGFSYNDPETAQTWSYADSYARNSGTTANQKFITLPVKNVTEKYSVRIISSPFNGIELGPNERSDKNFPVPIGTLPITFEWYNIGNSDRGTKTMYVYINKDRTKPITIKN